ncbi:ABC transporter substrate-binding protein [Fusibacter sp. 3D3]|uniref:ABC transporter substrate-binding protein n=1 Tax=Fusibacter sp. 3D3 TaxID=1048380 RepID=UPI0015868EC7|nr:ABC transporter substrate-binding protein [Fusibacter sp. 3D3]
MKKKWVLLLILGLLLSTNLVYVGAYADTASADEGAILKIGVKQEPDSLNPFAAWEAASSEIFQLTYDALTAFDRDLKVVPGLAESWEVSADQLTWTFHLRKEVKWHDGTPFTSADVKYTYEAIQETQMGMYYGSISDITNIEVVDDYTIKMSSKLPKANMLQNVTPILPEHIWSAFNAENVLEFENEQMIGTGPFKIVEWQRGQQVVFGRNADYFERKPQVNNLIYVIYANNDTMVQSFQNGEIDIALGLDYVDIKNILEDKNVKNYSYEENGFTELAFNSSEPNGAFNPLIQDKIVRHAIDYAIDKQKIVDLVYDSSAVPGTSYIPPSQAPWHFEPSKEELRLFNPEEAIKLLENAGFVNVDAEGIRSNDQGERLSFLLLSRSDNTSEVQVGQLIQSFLKDVGIELKIETVDDGVLNDRTMSTLDYDMFIWGWGGDIDPSVLLNVLTTANLNNLNDVFYSNPKYDEIVAKQATEMDMDKRIEMVHEAQSILYDDQPYNILYYSNNNQLVRTDLVSGLKPTSSGAIFYASSTANYLDAVLAGSSTGTMSSGMILIIVAVIVLAVIAGVFTLKKRTQKHQDQERQEW